MPFEASLYVHVPFCAGACGYCDFYSVPVKSGDLIIDKYLDRLLFDWELLFSKYHVEFVPTLYIGGGTPSLLGPRGIRRLLEGILSLLPASGRPLEISVEANPESADAAFLQAAREAGATRLSLGVQSFNEASRRAVHRLGGVSVLPERLALASRFFPGAFSADLISGLPFQTERILMADIERLLEYGPSHVSLYALSAEEGTPFFDAARGGLAGLPDETEAEELWISGRDRLLEHGRGQYEVSSFCPEGNECRHNIRYWRMENWLALGPAASATVFNDGLADGPADSGAVGKSEGGAFRYTVRPDTALWLQRPPASPPPVLEEILDPLTVMKESVMMGFRYSLGPSAELFKRRFGMSLRETLPRTLAAWEERGLLSARKDYPGREEYALTGEGLLFLNRFVTQAFDEIDEKISVK